MGWIREREREGEEKRSKWKEGGREGERDIVGKCGRSVCVSVCLPSGSIIIVHLNCR